MAAPLVGSRAGMAAYADHARTTASPAQLLVMLYDRLLLDLERGETALRAGGTASPDLLHAQDIVLELLTSLDPTLWSGGAALSSLYAYVHGRLVHANVKRDADAVAECRTLVAPLRDAWASAAQGTPVTSITDVPARYVPMTEPLTA